MVLNNLGDLAVGSAMASMQCTMCQLPLQLFNDDTQQFEALCAPWSLLLVKDAIQYVSAACAPITTSPGRHMM